MPGKLAGKSAIVTGAGSGIGEAIAVLFAQEGARVVVADVDVDGGQRTVERIVREGGEAIFVKVDVSSAAEVEHLVRTTVER